MISVAEESGRLDQELVRIANVTEGDLDRELKTAVALMEPMMLFFIAAFIGTVAGKVEFHALEDLPRMIDEPNRRPKKQWWLGLRTINNALARSGPSAVPLTEEVEQD